jgi:hypothetical protein
VVVAGEDMTAAVAFCRHIRLREVPLSPLLLVIRADQVGELLCATTSSTTSASCRPGPTS